MTMTHTFTRTHVRSITITGVDEKTPRDKIIELAARGAEIGFLWSETPEGRNRYPSFDWIMETAVAAYRRDETRLALHVCGSAARARLLTPDASVRYLLSGFFERIQINGTVQPDDLAEVCRRNYHATIITQHRPQNADLLRVREENHAILVDASGGQGISPAEWVHPATDKQVGFAGGLGPFNLATELPRIAKVARDSWWVDMEGKLRNTDDLFDVELAHKAITAFEQFDPEEARAD